MKRLLLLASALAFLGGCGYAISSAVLQEADRTVTFEELEARPEQYVGRLVILGGTIELTRQTAQGTVIEVAHKKLDHWGKPLPFASSGGGFVLISPGYLDQSFAPGRDITAAAVMEGTRHPGLDEQSFGRPVLLVRELKLWPPEHPSWYRPQYLDPLYDPRTSPRQY